MGRLIRKICTWRIARRQCPKKDHTTVPRQREMPGRTVSDSRMVLDYWFRINGIK